MSEAVRIDLSPHNRYSARSALECGRLRPHSARVAGMLELSGLVRLSGQNFGQARGPRCSSLLRRRSITKGKGIVSTVVFPNGQPVGHRPVRERCIPVNIGN